MYMGHDEARLGLKVSVIGGGIGTFWHGNMVMRLII